MVVARIEGVEIRTGVEVALTTAGAFTHRNQDIAGVALWLPALYATGQIGVGAIGKRLVDVRRAEEV